jgi:hypothetical protein
MDQQEPDYHKLLVFLSHAKEDKPAVRRLNKRLKADGFDPWLDEERLLPGQDWSLEIEKVMRASGAILLCFSERSIAKEGYIQREYKRAMQYQEEKPEGTIFVIPVRLDGCELPFSMRHIQYVDFPEAYDRLVQSLNQRVSVVTKTDTTMKKAGKEKQPSGKARSRRPTYDIQGGIHAGQVVMGDQIINNAGRDIIQGNQINITNNYAAVETPAELAAVLHQVLARIAALQQEAGLTSAQRSIVQSAGQKVGEAAVEAAKPQPLGERIKSTLNEAKETMDAIGGSLQSAAALGATIAGLIQIAGKLFGF